MTTGRIRLLPDALLSMPVFVVALLWGVVVQVGEWAALGEGIALLVERLALLAAVQVVMFAFPYVVRRVVCPWVPERHWNSLLMVSVIVGSIVRGIAYGILMFRIGVSESPELVYRVLASLTHMAVIVVLMWLLVSEVRGLSSRRRQLVSEREQLIRLQQETDRDLARLNATATDEIRNSILDSLGELEAVDSKQLLRRLRTTIDDVVRPLSHHLAVQHSTWRPEEPGREPPTVDWALAAREGLTPARIHPIIVPVVLVWLGIPIHLFQFGMPQTLGLIATLAVVIPTFWLARIVADRLTRNSAASAKVVAFVMAVVCGGLTLGLGTLTYMTDEPQPFVFVIVSPILALLVSGALAIAEAARDQDLALEAELRATTDDLRWTLTRTRERYRQQESALSQALHGRLQTSLTAAFLRLERSVNQGVNDGDLVNALRSEILQAIADLDLIDFHPFPIDDVVALIESNWSETAKLQFTIHPEAKVALAGDSLCARSVNDLIPELVFNSVKHGNARVIAVELAVADHRTLSLCVSDDGTGDPQASRPGLGSALLDEASITWRRSRSGAWTSTFCLIPFLTEGSSLTGSQVTEGQQRGRSGEPPRP